MKKCIVLLLLSMSISCEDPNIDWATVSIDPGQSFLLGELQDSSFGAKIHNLTNAVIDFSVIETATKKKRSGFGISEHGKVEIYIAKDETAVFTNNSGQEVKVKVLLNREVEGMRYIDVD